ncbi:MAG: DUF72 domain-containing protein [Gammaproteobacteria bacterium]
MQVRIGTSGWHYAHWRDRFYSPGLPARRWLEYYARHFDSVEINGSFYRLPKTETFGIWREQTPVGFTFAVKASRLITHMKKLKDAEQAWAAFLAAAKGLGEKLGPVLFQLPPNWRCDPKRLAAFLQVLPEGLEVAFELRDPSWHCLEVYRLLEASGATFCVYDLAGFVSPRIVTADFAYVRLHGPGTAYCGRYGKRALAGWGQWLRRCALDRGYVYFDNDQSAYAVTNALELKTLLATHD